MTAADDAYAAAERLIEEAKRTGAESLSFDTEETSALARLPKSIARLTRLGTLSLDNTQVSDLALLAGLTSLGALSLGNTQVSDLAPLAGLVGLWELMLGDTQVSDLAPLVGLMELGTLTLDGTQVSDLTPLAGLKELDTLTLDNTQVSDLAPLAGLTGLGMLALDNTQVLDLRHLMRLSKLAENPHLWGLTFEGIPATRDEQIAEIAAMADAKERAAALFALLEAGWVPPGVVEATVPSRLPAPLEIEVTDSLISVAGAVGLPRRDANARAELGWEALREYRQEFAAAFSVGNYAPLPSYLSAFDRAMGDHYDPARVVRIGVQAQRFVALSLDASFTGNLPAGAVGDLKMFAAEMLVYLNRFPDWVAYRDDAETVDPDSVREVARAFEAIQRVLEETPEVTAEVDQEYAAEVVEGTGENATEVESKALVASSREIPRAIAEYETLRRKYNRDLASKGGEFLDGLVRGPIGVPFHLARKLDKPMRILAKKFPNRFGWWPRWFDATLGSDDKGKS